ncbi:MULTISPECIES: BCCT family transporter [unclassified Halomonas]|uniref:BCCT family transporter n=1 Tax=unclassified Halomonas TaxID=2609666 RepID=UPI002883D803|nr:MULTISPECIES: BCCT family transporter [unclassified Halomonas]MDT0499648.1 BCCT family transporter [Halomonas sp. PAR7]MDT0510535.1 BCCT family transporter [Halomonas sp. LES1]MDT0592666.1 BCCT family transporter [Halomonas sp. PAR8]
MAQQLEDNTTPSGEGLPAPDGPTQLIDTDYQIGQDNIQTNTLGVDVDLHGKVFAVSALVVLFFVILTLALQDQVEPLFTLMRSWLTDNLAWFFIVSADVFVLLCIGLIISPLGRVRLGGPQARPDYGFLGWVSMLFAAGMGIGLIFYGVAEPVTHLSSSLGGVSVGESGLRTDWAPLGGAEGDAASASSLAMAATIYHWGLHPWAIYAVSALVLALFSFNKGLPLTMRSVLYPLLGERVWGWPGHIVDILAVFATLFGLATSLGIGASQATAGLGYLFDIPANNLTMVLLISGITVVALISVLAGVDKGVQRLSQLNMLVAFLLLLFVIMAGPTLGILLGFFENLTAYARHLPALSNPFNRTDANYSQGWTAFYWAWWISIAPLVGMFVARISRGRSVREFLIAVLLVPSVISAFWMTAFGNTAIDLLIAQQFDALSEAAVELQLFVMLSQLPLSSITSFLGIVLVIVFFTTTSDSGSLVIDSITSGGKVDAPRVQRVFWVIIEGAIAIALLLGGGLTALQAMVISTGVPFALVLLACSYAVIKGLLSEPRHHHQ